MFLLPAYRGGDLIPPLIETVLQQAKAEHVLEVRLYVHQDNARAIRAYQKQGFTDAPYHVMRQKVSSFPK
jgi:ribosomal protein S18 acetylase RimI-like enzyme